MTRDKTSNSEQSHYLGPRTVLALLALLLYLSSATLAARYQETEQEEHAAKVDRETRPAEEALRRLQDAYDSLADDKRDALLQLQPTVRSAGLQISPYVPAPSLRKLPIRLRGLAESSATVRGLVWDYEPNLEWVLRDLAFCFEALKGKPFIELSLLEASWTGYLLRLTVPEAQSLDQNISQVWSEDRLDPSNRGDEAAFEKFVRSISQSQRIGNFRKASDAEYLTLIRDIREYNIKRGIEQDKPALLGSNLQRGDDNDLNGLAVSVNATNAKILEEKQFTFRSELGLFGFELPMNVYYVAYPILAVFLNYLGMYLWREWQDRVGEHGLLRISMLLSLRGSHRVLDLGFLVALCGTVVSAIGAVLGHAALVARWYLGAVYITALLIVAGTWWRVGLFGEKRRASDGMAGRRTRGG